MTRTLARSTALDRPLTPKQQAFVAEYLLDLNATQAAIRAGYSRKTAHSIGDENLKKPEIAAAVASALAARSERVQLTADAVLMELAHLALSDIGEVLDFTGGTLRLREPRTIPERARRALSSLKVKRFPERVGTDSDGRPIYEQCELLEFKLHDKGAALEKAMRHLGMLKENGNTLVLNQQQVQIVYQHNAESG